MLKDLFQPKRGAMENGKFGTLRARVHGDVLEPSHYALVLFPMAEVLEGRQLLTSALTDVFVSTLVHDLCFPAEYVVQAQLDQSDYSTHKERTEALAKQHAEEYFRGERDE